MKKIITGVLTAVLITAVMATAKEPKYKAKVPGFVLTPDKVKTEALGSLEFFDGMPSEETVSKVCNFVDLTRGVEAFICGIPATSVYAMLRGFEEAGMKPLEISIFEQLMDARTIFMTPNSTTMYVQSHVDLSDGPIVAEIPPGVLGFLDDAYQRYVVDFGFAGPDQGKGGKYLLVPPGYNGELPDGYFTVKPRTYHNWFLLRAIPKGGDLKAAADGIKAGTRLYPLSKSKNQPKQVFHNHSGKQFNAAHANNYEFFEELNAVIQREPTNAFNSELVGILAAIGIKKGRPFEPDTRMKRILTEAAAIGNAYARALSFSPRKETVYAFQARKWTLPFGGGSYEFMDNGELVLDDRAYFHYIAAGVTPAMAKSSVGKGSAYIHTAKDMDGNYLNGGKTYMINVPGPVPAKDFWSFMVYSGQHRSMLETNQKTAGVDSLSKGLKANTDGSYTVWFGPEAPKGKEGNWVQTMPGKSFHVLFRLYGPLKPWFDKSWKIGDFELVK
jgi:hypothetical protein